MFSIYHIVWIVICIVLIIASIYIIHAKKPSYNDFFNWVCFFCILSEVVKVFSVIEVVPSADGTAYYPYIELQHLPLHLCSIMIIFIFIARFSKANWVKDYLVPFMYPATLYGGILAIALPSIFGNSIEVTQAFTHPLAYQYFLYHAMMIVTSYYIFKCDEIELKPKHYGSTLVIILGLGFLSLYMNSMFAEPVYENGVLVSVEYVTNFFFTYKTPIGIALTETWQWYVYMAIITVLVFVLIAVAFIPVFRKAKKEKTKQIE